MTALQKQTFIVSLFLVSRIRMWLFQVFRQGPVKGACSQGAAVPGFSLGVSVLPGS